MIGVVGGLINKVFGMLSFLIGIRNLEFLNFFFGGD